MVALLYLMTKSKTLTENIDKTLKIFNESAQKKKKGIDFT